MGIYSNDVSPIFAKRKSFFNASNEFSLTVFEMSDF